MLTDEQQAKILAQAQIVAASYNCPWDREHVNAIEDFWLIAQDDLDIPEDEKIILPDSVVDQLI